MDNINKFNTIEELENYRNKLNEACDERAEYLTLINEASSLVSMSFPYLKESMDSMAKDLFLSERGRKIIAKYTKTVKENKDLVKLYNICESVKNADKETDVDFFMDSISKEKYGINRKNIEEGREKVARIVAEAYVVLGKNAESVMPEHDVDLDSAIMTISEEKKSGSDLADYSRAMKVIRERIEAKEPKEKVYEVANLEEIASRLISGVNSKYSTLTNEEKEAVKAMATNENKESVFEKYKGICIDKLEEENKKYIAGSANSNKISAIIESVKSKQYSDENDINNLLEMIKIFE